MISNRELLEEIRDDLKANNTVHYYIESSGAISTTIYPTVPFRLLSLDLHASAALAGTSLTITKDAGRGADFDTLVYSFDIATAAATSHYKTFEGRANFSNEDRLVIAQSNTGGKDIGIDVAIEKL